MGASVSRSVTGQICAKCSIPDSGVHGSRENLSVLPEHD